MKPAEAKQALDKVVAKARVHMYKPIQIAEILYRDRAAGDIDLSTLDTYRNASKKWRDEICIKLTGRASTSSARYQDDLFNDNAVPPSVLAQLGRENRRLDGAVEAYIYKRFKQSFSNISVCLGYCASHNRNSFQLKQFLDLFWNEPGLRRSIDKVYEIVVYSLFSTLVHCLGVRVVVEPMPDKAYLLREFSDFAERVIGLSPEKPRLELNADIYRVGVTNAADRGLDMWANYGMAIQVKHLSLTEELAENIVSSVSSDRIVIVCKDSEEKLIVSLLTQIGWKSRIQSVITESDLIQWYEKALRGSFAAETGDYILKVLCDEVQFEFPATQASLLEDFMSSRGYDAIVSTGIWSV